MQASTPEFRFRFLIHLVIYALGFTAPWNLLHAVDTGNLWSWLMAVMTTHAPNYFLAAANGILGLGIFFALAAALLRTWASAYLGASIVQDAAMHGQQVVAAGPYRFVRNPLYIAVFLHTLALALLMPPTGALFALIAVTVFDLRLVFGEELFLTAQLGQSYLDYKARVPRLVPAILPRTAPAATKPSWPLAFLSEIYFWGFFLTLMIFGRQFNPLPLERGILISFGLSIVMRALLPKERQG